MPLTAPFALPSLSSNLIPDLRSAVSHALALLSLAPIAFLLYRLFIAPVLFTIYSPLRIVPRIEKRDSRWTGNVAAVYTDEPAVAQMKWLAEKKSTVVMYPSFLGANELFVADPAAISWILGSNGHQYKRSEAMQRWIRLMIGEGLVTQFDENHKKQRRIITPAFAPSHLRTVVPTFFSCAEKMLLNMEKNILTEHYPTTASKGPVVEVLQHLSAATLDIIGQAGFGYDFHSLDTGSECGSELSAAFSEAVRLAMTVNPVVMFIVNLMAVYVPPVVDAPVIERNRKIRDARKRMEAISGEFLKSKKKDIEKELENEGGNVENPEKDSEAFAPKDLLHVLMKANMAADLEPSQRLTDEELAGQVTTFIFAGHETSSTSTTWLLHLLSRHPAVQSRLQSEIDNLYSHLHSSGKQHPTWDEISNLSYLSAVVNETLRIVPAAPALFRVAEQDDVIPLSRPVPRADGKGMLSHINVPKGTSITIGLKAANLDPEIWGADADEFKPERWLDPARARRASLSTTTASSPTDEKSSSELQTPSQSPAQAQAQEHTPASLAPTSANGLWTFSSGPKMCIGYRFANVEIKVLAMTMLRAYTVESVEELVIRQKDGIVVRPEIRGREKEGRQLPLRFVKRGAAAGQKEKERESASADA